MSLPLTSPILFYLLFIKPEAAVISQLVRQATLRCAGSATWSRTREQCSYSPINIQEGADLGKMFSLRSNSLTTVVRVRGAIWLQAGVGLVVLRGSKRQEAPTEAERSEGVSKSI